MTKAKKALRKIFFALSFFVFSAAPAMAQVNTNIEGIALSDRSPIEIIIYLISWVLGILALLTVVIILYAGFVWLTSGGNEQKIEYAKLVLRNAIIGLVIILSAWGFVLWLLGILTDATGGGGGGCTGSGCCTGCDGPPDGGGSTFYVLSTDPVNEELGVYLCTDVKATFNKTVDQDSVTEDTYYLQVDEVGTVGSGQPCTQSNECTSSVCTASVCEGDHVPGTIAFGPGEDNRIIEFIPSNDLEEDTGYKMTIIGGESGVISDPDGLTTDDYEWTFSTGTETDTIPPTVELNCTDDDGDGIPDDDDGDGVPDSCSSPFPMHHEVDVCTNTTMSYDFSESMRVSTFNDDTSVLLDGAGISSNPGDPDWSDLGTDYTSPDWTGTEELRGWTFGANYDYFQARPNTQLNDFSLYSVRLYGGDVASSFAGALTDSCGNPLDGDEDGTSEGSTKDNYYGYDSDAGETEDPLLWETGENSECTPVIDSFTPTYDYYGEYAGLRDGEACTDNSDCASGVCTSGLCVGYGATTLTINGLYLGPHPTVRMDGSEWWAGEGINTCFDVSYHGNVSSDTSIGDVCLDDDANSNTNQVKLRSIVGAADTNLYVSVAGETSEASGDELDILSPYIEYISPSDGAVGQYITVTGENYGVNQGSGTVYMYSFADEGNIRVSELTLPDVCGDVWDDDQIIVIAPESWEYADGSGSGDWEDGDVAYIQIFNDSDDYSDLQRFEFSNVTRPNLCSIVEDCHSAGGEEVTLTGEKFGDERGESVVAFAIEDGAGYNPSSYSTWLDQSIVATTSTDMEQADYDVSVYDATTDLNSNWIDYDIPCDDGPQVVNISSCSQEEGVYPVPNPRPNKTDACLNANIGILFDQEVDIATLNADTVYLQQYNACDNGETCNFNAEYSPLSVDGDFMTTSWSYEYLDETYYGFQWDVQTTFADEDQDGAADGDTSSYLQRNTWYVMTLTTGITNEAGNPMSSDYTLRFRTDDTDELCELDSIDVAPSSSTQNEWWDASLNGGEGGIAREEYEGSAYDAECNLLDASGYSWSWGIDDTSIGSFDYSTLASSSSGSSSEEVFVSGDDEDNEGTATITTTADAESDTATFRVDLGFCETDDDCSSCAGSECNEESSHCTPIINSFSPSHGDNGTWTTISGCMFGSSKGNVYWTNNDIDETEETDWPDAARCGDTWSSTTIIAEVPAQYDSAGDEVDDTDVPDGDYTVTVETKYEDTDDADDTFEIDSLTWPGICSPMTLSGKEGDEFTVYGQSLGTDEGKMSFFSENDYDEDGTYRVSATDEQTTAWSEEEVTSVIAYGSSTGIDEDGERGYNAVISGGDESCATDGECSNALDLVVTCDLNNDCATGCCSDNLCRDASVCDACTDNADCDECSADGVCNEDGQCNPQITELDYPTGPNEGPVTISGCYFGSSQSGDAAVTFTKEDGTDIEAEILCSTHGWSRTQIIAEVPPETDIPIGEVAEVNVTKYTGHETLTGEDFTVTEECTNGGAVPSTGVPVLCIVRPSSGGAASEDGSTTGDRIAFVGDNQVDPTSGSGMQRNYFYNEVEGDGFVYESETVSKVSVPYGAATGEAYLATADNRFVQTCQGNGLDFAVECHTSEDCVSGYCVSGLCIDDGETECNDGTDNDGDGYTDAYDDPQCDDENDDSEASECTDSADNDEDGFTDYAADGSGDPDCDDSDDDNETGSGGSGGTDPECSDSADNDGDGYTDYNGGDPECDDSDDTAEAAQCDDDEDNNGNGLTDWEEDTDSCDDEYDDDETESSRGSSECDECSSGTWEEDCGESNGCYLDSGCYICEARPELNSSHPEDGATDVCPNSAGFTMTFSEEMSDYDAVTLYPVEDADEDGEYEVAGADVSLTVTDHGDGEYEYDPASLTVSTIYQLSIPSGTDGLHGQVRSSTTGLTLSGESGVEETITFTTASSTCVPDHIGLENDETGDTTDFVFTSEGQESDFTSSMYSSDDQELESDDEYEWEYTWSPYYDEENCENVAWVDLDDPECSDTVDNDGDGYTDYGGSDPECVNAYDETETSECSDGEDNDEDGFTDLDDSDCSNGYDERESEISSNISDETQTVVAGSEHAGETTLDVSAYLTDDGTTVDTAEMTVHTYFCDEGESWAYIDETGWKFEQTNEDGDTYTDTVDQDYPQHFRLLYCDTEDLPTFPQPVISKSATEDWFLQYLFSDPDNEDTAFGIRIYNNDENLTPEAWYNANVPSPGTYTATEVDGYQAVVDGRSYYISFSNMMDANDPVNDLNGNTLYDLYNNIFLITFNDDETMDEIADDIIDNLLFNTNLSYAECEGSEKEKLVRDTKRQSDLGTFIQLAQDYYADESEYPLPESVEEGISSYLTELTTSVWPSWQGALGNLFGSTLPEDYYNFFYAAEESDPWNADSTPAVSDDDSIQDCELDEDVNNFDETNCWDTLNNRFYCPTQSSTYMYKIDTSNQDQAYIYARMEYKGIHGGREDYLNAEYDPTDNNDPCSGVTSGTAECQCYNHGLKSDTSGDPGTDEWVEAF